MSKPAIPIVIATCLLAGFLLGAIALPRMWFQSLSPGRQAVHDTPAPTIQETTRKAVDQEGRKAADDEAQKAAEVERQKAAKRFSDQLLASARAGETAGKAARTFPSLAAPVRVERNAFGLTLPSGSRVHSADPKIGSERFFSASLPSNCAVTIVVADNREQANNAYDSQVSGVRERVDRAEEAKPAALNALRLTRETAMLVTAKGEDSVVEIGLNEGWEKTCMIVVVYTVKNKDESVALLEKVLGTFHMKQ